MNGLRATALVTGMALVLLLAGTASAAQGRWTTTSLPGAPGPVLALVVDPAASSTVYAGTVEGGILKSIDSGVSWSPANAGLPVSGAPSVPPPVLTMAVHPSAPATIFAGTDTEGPGPTFHPGGIFRSVDGAASWAPLGAELAGLYVSALAIHPTSPNVMYAGTSGGIYKSTNGGLNWTTSSTGLLAPDVWALALSPTNPDVIFAGAVPSILGSRAVFRSVDAGATWAAVGAPPNTPSPVGILTIRAGNPETLYAAQGSAGSFSSLSRSLTGGATFSFQMAGGLSGVSSLIPDRDSPTRLFAGSYGGGVFLIDEASGGSSDSARLSRPFNSGLSDLNVTTLGSDPSTRVLYAGTDSGQVAGYGVPLADLALSVSRSPVGVVAPGSAVSTIFTVTNGGPEAAPDVRLTLPFLGSNVVPTTAAPASCSVAFSSGQCALGDLAPGASATVTVPTTVPGGDAEVFSIARDPNVANNRSAPPPFLPGPPVVAPPPAAVARRPAPPRVSALTTACSGKPVSPKLACRPRVRFRLNSAVKVRLSVVRLVSQGRVGSFTVSGRAGLNTITIPKAIARRLEPGRFRILARPLKGGQGAVRATLVVRPA
jgi:Domain of unknown function DUF11